MPRRRKQQQEPLSDRALDNVSRSSLAVTHGSQVPETCRYGVPRREGARLPTTSAAACRVAPPQDDPRRGTLWGSGAAAAWRSSAEGSETVLVNMISACARCDDAIQAFLFGDEMRRAAKWSPATRGIPRWGRGSSAYGRACSTSGIPRVLWKSVLMRWSLRG